MSAQSTGWYARLSASPALMALIGGQSLCAVGSTLLYWNRAPFAYLEASSSAMFVGIAVAIPLLFLPVGLRWPALLAAAALLATSVFGIEQEGIRRWASVAGSPSLQPAFLLLPLLAVSYARAPDDRWHLAAMLVAALAVALQPDRSMAAALVIVAALIAALRPKREAFVVLAITVVALAITLWRQDPLGAVPFVEGVIVMAWQSGWWARSLMVFVAILLLSPIADYRKVSVDDRRAIIAFILCWATLFIASIIAPYPTPLLGYGPSAIIGYFLSIVALRRPSPAKPSPDQT